MMKADVIPAPIPATAQDIDVEAAHCLDVPYPKHDMVDRSDFDHWRSSAATPGSVRPSIHSRNAPPAVETNVKSRATSARLSAATVSPPPATETSEPSLVSAAAV